MESIVATLNTAITSMNEVKVAILAILSVLIVIGIAFLVAGRLK